MTNPLNVAIDFDVANDPLIAVADFMARERGSDPLNEIVMFIASYFGVDYVHIGLLEPEGQSVRVVAGCLDGRILAPGYVYMLAGTPCEHVVANDHQCYEENVQELFPDDVDLRKLKAQGYIGEPIYNDESEAMGLIVLTSRRRLKSSDAVQAVTRIMSSYTRSILSQLQVEKLLRREKERYRRLMRHASDGILLFDEYHHIVEYNEKAKQMLAYNDDEMSRLTVFDIDAKFSREKLADIRAKVSEGTFSFDTVHRRKDGTLYDAAVTAVKLELDGHITYYTSMRDITEIVQARRKLESGRNRLEAILQTTREAFLLMGSTGEVIDSNHAMCDILGYSRESLQGMMAADIDAYDDKEATRKRMEKIVREGSALFETRYRHQNGALIDVEVSASHMPSEDLFIVFIRDITQRKKLEAELKQIAHYDVLTGLPNRLLFGDRIHQAMKQVQRQATGLAVLYIDLDGFKDVNDTYGHHVGDLVLIGVGERLLRVLRQGDTLARLGGDEFIVLLTDLHEPTESLPIIERLLEAGAAPYHIKGHTMCVTLSIGVSYYPQTQKNIDAERVIRQSDRAMYQAKEQGKNCYRIYEPSEE